MSITTGKTAYMRTSNEEVYVLGTKELQPFENMFPELGTTVVFVRRPIAGQNGLSHVLESYYPGELTTVAEVEAEREEAQKQFDMKLKKARQEAGLGDANEAGTLPN